MNVLLHQIKSLIVGIFTIAICFFVIYKLTYPEISIIYRAINTLVTTGSLPNFEYPSLLLIYALPDYLISWVFHLSESEFIYIYHISTLCLSAVIGYFSMRLLNLLSLNVSANFVTSTVLVTFLFGVSSFDRLEPRIILSIVLGLYFYAFGELRAKTKYQLLGYSLLFLAGFSKIFPFAFPAIFLIFEWKRRNYKLLLQASLLFLGFCILNYFYYFVFHFGSLSFLTYHSLREFHIESTYGSVLLLLEKINFLSNALVIKFTYGSRNIINPEFFDLRTLASIILILFEISTLIFYLFKTKLSNNFQKEFLVCLNFIVFMLLGFLVFSKVLSPQFIFFAFLFLNLVIQDPKFVGHRLIVVLVLICAFTTTLIYPITYYQLVNKNTLIELLLFFRNLSLVFLFFSCYVRLKRFVSNPE